MKKIIAGILVGLLCSCGGSGDTSTGGGGSSSSSGGSSSSSGGSSGGVSGTLVTVDSATRYQTISGWEATANVDEREGDLTLDQAKLYDNAAVDQVGITRLRLEVRSGMEGQIGAFTAFSNGSLTVDQWHAKRYPVINDDNNPNTNLNALNPAGFDFTELDHNVDFIVIPMRDRLAAKGEKLFVNLCYVSFNNGVASAFRVHDDPQEYAEFALATMQHLKAKYNLVPDTWEVILEPDYTTGTHWDGQKIGQIIVATAQRFAANGFGSTKFIAPSAWSMANASDLFNGIAGVSGAVSKMAEISYHRYAGVTPSALSSLTQKAQNNGLGLSMLELWFGQANADVLFEDLGAGAVAFQGRVVQGLFTGPPTTSLTMNSDVLQNSAVYRAVRPGAVRIGAQAQGGVFTPLAFQRPDGKVVVALKASAAGTATLRNLSPGNYRVTTVTSNVQSGPTTVTHSTGDLSVSITGPGVLVAEPL